MYRVNSLNNRSFFSYEGVPGVKIDKDCVFYVWLQESPNCVIVFQPVVSGCENVSDLQHILKNLAMDTASMIK